MSHDALMFALYVASRVKNIAQTNSLTKRNDRFIWL